jgi:NADPH-dependent 2,4-dienoyl-CoA reductase/sulfur reductase-like enzyme
MNHLIIGAGPAGVVAAETLRTLDPESAVTIVGDEEEPPYARMALPYLLANSIGEDGTHLRRDSRHFERLGIELRRARVEAVSPDAHALTLAEGERLGYDRLLVASGAHTTRPPLPGMDLRGVENCWTLADARRIADLTEAGSRVVLMGAGFIGCIVLEALAARGVQLTVVEMADRMLARMMDEAGGDMIKRWCESKGVTVLTSVKATGVERCNGDLRLALDSGDFIIADLIVCATGVAPNVDFLQGSGVDLEQGILVDEHLRTSVADVYAAGDVAQGPDFSSARREIHAIQPTAVEHGRIAAMNMAGRTVRFGGSLSMNVLNTLGLVSSSFGLWAGVEGGERAVVYDRRASKYLRLEFDEDRLAGALALGLTEHVGVLRGLIQTRLRLGPWKERLLKDPHRVMEAYLERTQGSAQLRIKAMETG